jgi:DNA-binding NtrC family response regulator
VHAQLDSVLKKVVVIDDERIIADTIATILRKSGFDATPKYDADSALEHFACSPPEIVLSDVDMPGMNGVELAISLKARFPDCRVILFSGQAVTADLVEEARSRGYHFEVLAKPIHPTDLLKVLAG